MKNVILSVLTATLLSLTAFAQNYQVTVNGTVMLVYANAMIPAVNQPVFISIDSTANGFNYQSQVFTDENGYYEDNIDIPGFNGYGMVHAMTFDSCLNYYQSNSQPIVPGVTLIPMDFYLCNTIYPECQASFYYYQADPGDPYTLAFMNSSYGNFTEVLWSFGDSTYSYEPNPVHTFPSAGTYTVCLTISDGNECNSTYCEIVYTGGGASGCENYFYYEHNGSNTVTFTGSLMNGQDAAYYSWDFGDGTYGSGQTVTHTYELQGIGIYLVGLTTMVLDSNGIDTCTYTSYQEVWLDNQTGGCESWIIPMTLYGLTVDFEGYTVSPYETLYTWEFGDGVTGTGQYVSHTYPQPGLYTVTLNTVDDSGCAYQSFAQIWLSDSVNTEPCRASFTYEETDSNNYTFYGYVFLDNGGYISDSMTVYTWNFGDGTTGTGQTIEHYFQENPAGGYTVCLTVSTIMPDGSVCTAEYCEYVYLMEPSFNIFGFVYLENNLHADQAEVHLMSMDTLWQGVTEVATVLLDSSGYYQFTGVPMYNTRVYYVQAELTEGSAYYGDYLPTYHYNAMNWEEANPILPLNNWPADIFMIPGAPVEGGNGSIAGVVSELGARSFMEDVEVVLLDSENQPLVYTRSDSQGNFNFTGLALGTYVIHAEIMGVHTIQAAVTLSEQQPIASVEVQVSGSEANVVFGIPDIPIAFESIGEIYPNPVNADSRIDIVLKSDARLQISTFSITGQLVSSRSLDLQKGTHSYRLETGSLPQGFYMFRIVSGQGDVVSRKFIIK